MLPPHFLTSILKLLSIFRILDSLDSTSLILFDLSDPDDEFNVRISSVTDCISV